MGAYKKVDIEKYQNVEPINNAVQVEQGGKGFLGKVAVAVMAFSGLLVQSAHASVEQIGNAFTGAFAGVSAPLTALFVAAAAILTLFVAWRYFKRGANSA